MSAGLIADSSDTATGGKAGIVVEVGAAAAGALEVVLVTRQLPKMSRTSTTATTALISGSLDNVDLPSCCESFRVPNSNNDMPRCLPIGCQAYQKMIRRSGL